MSVAEMKVKAIEKLTAINDEESLKEILIHLEKLNEKKFNADDFFRKTSEKYDDVLKNLAK